MVPPCGGPSSGASVARVRLILLPFVSAVIGAFLLSHAIHLLVLLIGAFRRTSPSQVGLDDGDMDELCIQIPVYNDGVAAAGAIHAVRQMRWEGLATVQILDDSDDQESCLAIDQACLEPGALPVQLVRRADRRGYKAGALAEGMDRSKAKLFAIFDSDFRPGPMFCRDAWRTMRSDARCGFVQGRWGHLNESECMLTRSLAIGIDAHFSIEQSGRQNLGGILNFNGTAGLWRRAAIEESGGWQSDTLTEDLDLSYRAGLKSWTGIYDDSLVADAEIPPRYDVWIRQQKRWARGSAQCAKKIIPRILVASLPWGVKILGFFHLTHYLIHPALVSLVLILPWLPQASVGVWLLLMIAFPTLIVLLMHCRASWSRDQAIRWTAIPGQMFLGMSATPHLALAVLQGLFVGGGVFRVTPKGRQARSFGGERIALIEGLWIGLLIAGIAISFDRGNMVGMVMLAWFLAGGLLSIPYRGHASPHHDGTA